MANLMFKTKGMVNPKGKPRVYFTCHPDDFIRTFDKVSGDLLKVSDCAIYYTENMNEVLFPWPARRIRIRLDRSFSL